VLSALKRFTGRELRTLSTETRYLQCFFPRSRSPLRHSGASYSKRFRDIGIRRSRNMRKQELKVPKLPRASQQRNKKP
jgi:hypothetical protein